jgi:hypothetical protein
LNTDKSTTTAWLILCPKCGKIHWVGVPWGGCRK